MDPNQPNNQPYQPNDPASPQPTPQPINQQTNIPQQTPVGSPVANQPQVFTPNMAIPDSPSPTPAQPQSYYPPQNNMYPNPPQPQTYQQLQQYPSQPIQSNINAVNNSASYDQFLGTSLPNPDAKRRKIGLIVIGLVILLIIIGGFIFASKGGNPVSNISNKISGNSDVVSRSDGTLDLSELIDDLDENQKSQNIKAKLNQQINLADGLSYMVTGVERNYSPTTNNLKPAEGKEVIKVDLVIGNKRKQNNLYIYEGLFSIINSAGGEQRPLYAAENDPPNALISDDLSPGKQTKASIIFEVDKDEKIEKLITSQKYDNYKTKEQIELKSEVSL